MDIQFELKQSETLGRHLVAKKDWVRGQLIFSEQPILVYPDVTCRARDLAATADKFVCYCCFRISSRSTAVSCKRCHWPACSVECSLSSDHKRLECSIFCENNVAPSSRAAKHLCMVRTVVSRTRNSRKWEEVLSKCCDTNYCKYDWRKRLNEAALDAFDFLITHCKIKVRLTVVQKLVSIFSINAFPLIAETLCDEGYRDLVSGYRALYGVSTLLSNSCWPNAKWYIPRDFDEENGQWGIQLFAIRDIRAGEKVTIAYCDKYLDYGTPQRRRRILDNLHFFCQCERCCDPTELQTYCSSVKCIGCKGWMIPMNTANAEVFLMFGVEWKCGGCNRYMPWRLAKQIESCFQRKVMRIWSLNKENPRLCAQKLDEAITTVRRMFGLHLNHTLVIRTVHRWLTITDMDILLQSSKASKKAFQKYLCRCYRCLRVYRKIGCVKKIVKIEGLMAMINIRYRFKCQDYMTLTKGDYSLGQLTLYTEEIVEHMKTVVILGDRKTNNGKETKIVQLMKEKLGFWEERLAKLVLQIKRRSRHPADSKASNF